MSIIKLVNRTNRNTFIRKIGYLLLLLFLCTDLYQSFDMYHGQTLDGDIACNMVPAQDVQPILDNPLGIQTILQDKTYANPNRFFCHWLYKEYLTKTPLLLQSVVEPIESVYLSTALAKTAIQLLLIVLLAMGIAGTTNVLRLRFVATAAMVTPFFQTNGLRDYIGIIDCSITYTFFYALPCVFVILYFLPLSQRLLGREQWPIKRSFRYLWLIPLAFVVCLSGPLNPGVVLVIAVLMVGSYLWKRITSYGQYHGTKKGTEAITRIPVEYWFYLVPVVFLSAYSLFLGQYNSLTIESRISLSEMYLRLPYGVFLLFKNGVAFPVLIGVLLVNILLIRYKYDSNEGAKIIKAAQWIGLFAICYILLLPLGGYREYRHYILRYDTIMPITLALLFIYGVSCLYLYKAAQGGVRFFYVILIVVVGVLYTKADRPWGNLNACERSALQKIAVSNNSVVELNEDYTVVAWTKIDKPEYSELNARLLVIWNITNTPKLYYQK